MSKPIFRFDANLEHQGQAVAAVADLFDGLVSSRPEFSIEDAIIPNLPSGETLDQELLLSNLRIVQRRMREIEPRFPLSSRLELDEGLPLEIDGLNNTSTVTCPSFTVEMETGTGKTYCYFRSMYELCLRCGFTKFVIVVPSVAIFEGIVKTHEQTREHFASLYGNERPPLVQYDGARVSELRSFASSFKPIVLVTTLAAFNKSTNIIYKASDRLPGELLPIEYVSRTRPVVILDEPQNYGSEKAKAALRRLDPLVTLRYSATHKENPNPIYRLSPFEAFRRDLVKKVAVAGFSLEGAVKKNELRLIRVDRAKQSATVLATKDKEGKLEPGEISLKQDQDLEERTKNRAYRGMLVHNIDFANGIIEFTDGTILSVDEVVAGSDRKDLVRAQIRETIQTHLRRQDELRGRGIKVLSLFFVDKVSHFRDEEDGYIRIIFDEELKRAIKRDPILAGTKPEELRVHYFASVRKKKRGGEDSEVFLDEIGGSPDEKEAEKQAYDLIMRDKETLLSLDEKKAFIFAHSALREGWDNPNVFQICSLNEAKAETRKRQEIGRGLRLPVDQAGNRVIDQSANVLTVVAAESYASFARALQDDYEADGQVDRVPIANARRNPVRRNQAVFESPEFKRLAGILSTPAHFKIDFTTEDFVYLAVEGVARHFELPLPRIELRKGAFGFVRVEFSFEEYFIREFMGTRSGVARLRVKATETVGAKLIQEGEVLLAEGERLSTKLDGKYPFLESFILERFEGSGDEVSAVFANGRSLDLGETESLVETMATEGVLHDIETRPERFPLPNIVSRVASATGLTRRTVFEIWKRIPEAKKKPIFLNPEGYVDRFSKFLSDVVGDYVANELEFVPGPADGEGGGSKPSGELWGVPGGLAAAESRGVYAAPALEPTTTVLSMPIEQAFPDPYAAVPSELVRAGPRALYEAIQTDSLVERKFVEDRLEAEAAPVLYYLKFPPSFKIKLPKVIGGNYNPDWAICLDPSTGRSWIVRETKGNEDIEKLRFSSEARKVVCGFKYFKAVGLEYSVVNAESADWLSPRLVPYKIGPRAVKPE
jgi:type III restriction enzyme